MIEWLFWDLIFPASLELPIFTRPFYYINFVSRFLTVQISIYWANFTKSDSKVKDKSHKLEQTLKLQRCDCTRSRQIISLSSVNFSNTSCGRDAYMRGPHQKVVSFSFYGNKSSPSHLLQGFFEGMIEELKWPPAFILCRYKRKLETVRCTLSQLGYETLLWCWHERSSSRGPL